MTDDSISRQAAIEAMQDMCEHYTPTKSTKHPHIDFVVETLEELPSAQKHGKWLEKHHAYSDEESVIEEWQSCRCSECGRYDTRPYMYYFSEPNYCSFCGADMRGKQDG